MDRIGYFAPNNKTHPAFGEALIAAVGADVRVFAMDCAVTENSLNIGGYVPAVLFPKEVTDEKRY